METRTKTYNSTQYLSAGVADVLELIKFKLTSVVVITSILAYVVASQFHAFDWYILGLLTFGGFLVASAANAMNEVLEKDFDILMERTKNRPVATGRMKVSDAVMISGLLCLAGIVCLALINPLTAFLGMISFVLYAFIYTPLKRYSTVAVAVGAIPGALPALIGVSACTGEIGMIGLLLFSIQFLWQFPHFWAIGFLGFDDYNKAGYKLVPMQNGEVDRNIGLHSFIYALILIPLSGAFYFIMPGVEIWIASLAVVLSIIYAYYSYGFYKGHDKASARELMFFSFLYMPVIFFIYLMA